MANKLISQLGALTTGNIEADDLFEVQEADQVITKKVTLTVLTELEAAARAAQDDVIEASVGLSAAGAYVPPVGSNYIDASTDVMDAVEMLDDAIGASGSAIVVDIIPISAANLNNAGITPYELVAAPGATRYIEVLHMSIYRNFLSVRLECGTQKLIVQYDTGASHFVEWSNVFIELNSDGASKGTWTSNVDMVLNKKVEITFDGGVNPTAGDTSLKVWIVYIVRDTASS